MTKNFIRNQLAYTLYIEGDALDAPVNQGDATILASIAMDFLEEMGLLSSLEDNQKMAAADSCQE